MNQRLEDIYKSAEPIRTATLEFTDNQSAHLCYLFIRDSGHVFNDLQHDSNQVTLRIHFGNIPELVEDLKSQDGENYWILENLSSLRLVKPMEVEIESTT
jgi:hypothetical protein